MWVVDILKVILVTLLGIAAAFITWAKSVKAVTDGHILYGACGVLAAIGLLLFALLTDLRMIISWYI